MSEQLPLSLPFTSAMGSDDFLVTPENRDAAAWIEKWPDWPQHGSIVTGLPGSGKSHLLTVWIAKSRAVSLTRDDIESLDITSLPLMPPMIAIDDADHLCGNRAAEENLFHLFNHLKTSQGSLLLTMQSGAGQAGFTLADLRSRLLALPAVALGMPDDMLLQALIVKQFRDRQISLDSGVIHYLLSHIPRDAGGIPRVVEKLDRTSLSENKKITVAFAKRVLEER